MRFRVKSMTVILLAVGFSFAAITPEAVFSQTPYYQGKTITIVRGGEPGGSGDMQARALIPLLKKYIPGNPTIIIENMPGAAGMKAVNHIYSGKARWPQYHRRRVGSSLGRNPRLAGSKIRYRQRIRFSSAA